MSHIQTFRNLAPEALVAHALKNKEGVLAANGALTVETGARTGRSPKDRFIVKDAITESTVEWGAVNQAFDPAKFDKLYDDACAYIATCDHYISDVQVGADPKHAISVEMQTETAWQHLFGRCLFIERSENSVAEGRPHWKILNVPGFEPNPEIHGTNSNGCVILNFTRKIVLLCGMRYAGEMKKAMFSVMNFIMPEEETLPMHCGANVGESGNVALFFGLSGTGKTTLSSDPNRYLLGDDEHGWTPTGTFNFEGGCYAKCIDLSQEREPLIWNAIQFGSIMENVILNPETLEPDYHDTRLTQNTRAAYPLKFIEKRIQANYAGLPNSVVFLTCDLYGVLPPVARLTREQAAYYFLSGYTALVGSTEMGHGSGIKTTFSTCFGAPFFSRPPKVYADLLMKKLDQTGAKVYLVNTGWSGGGYGKGGERFSIPTTRNVVTAIVEDQLANAKFETLPGFNFEIPVEVPGVDAQLLDPRKTWKSQADYEANAKELIEKFHENFKRFDIGQAVKDAGPK
jgi:phosphoenolpyruvate carboxykinase (ATP)